MSSPPLWLPLADVQAATLDLAGGKGASLARMAAAGLPVPQGFVLTTAAYKRAIVASELDPEVVAAMANPLAIFENAALPEDVLAAIRTVVANDEDAARPSTTRWQRSPSTSGRSTGRRLASKWTPSTRAASRV